MSDRRSAIMALLSQFPPQDPNLKAPSHSLPLASIPFGEAEIAEAIDSLLSGWLTMGPKVSEFERLWAENTGVDHAIAVNSGSSALLVMLSALVACGDMSPGDEVLVPAVGWSTSLFSIVQAGLKPVLVDVDPDTLCIEGERDRPVLALHLLGCPSRVRSPLIIEDACGAHGASISGKRVGSLGVAGAFSFFFSHHISTIEGGMITTDRRDLLDAARSIRAHGWIRERTDRQSWVDHYPDIDPRFLFALPGYNLRMTEISGAFGIHQVPRLDDFVAQRRRNHRDWCLGIQSLGLPLRVFPTPNGVEHAAFAFPIMLDADSPLTRSELCQFLESKNISTRPISGSHLARQPAFSKIPSAVVEGETPVADAVHKRGFFVGQSHAFDASHGDYLMTQLKAAFSR